MKSKMIAFFLSVAAATTSFMKIPVVSADNGINNYISQQYLISENKSDIDWNLFNRYIKYSLNVNDYDALSEDEKLLCQRAFVTERTYYPNVYCANARNELTNKTHHNRISFENPQSIASVVNPIPDYYSCFNDTEYIIPDIIYSNFYDDYFEYWLNDEGTERIILSSFSDEFEYIKFYESMPKDKDIAKIPYRPLTEKHLFIMKRCLKATIRMITAWKSSFLIYGCILLLRMARQLLQTVHFLSTVMLFLLKLLWLFPQNWTAIRFQE